VLAGFRSTGTGTAVEINDQTGSEKVNWKTENRVSDAFCDILVRPALAGAAS
jgi:hypothetical protein